MKQFTFFTCLLFTTLITRAQNTALVVDQKYVVGLEKSVRVMTFSDTILHMLLREERAIIINYVTHLDAHDTKGPDFWTINFKPDAEDKVRAFFKRHDLKYE